jgi:hypothetical protein
LWDFLAETVANYEYRSAAMVYKPYLSLDCLISLLDSDNNCEIHEGIFNIFAAFVNLESNKRKTNVFCSNILPERYLQRDIYQQILFRLDKLTFIYLKPTKLKGNNYTLTVFIKLKDVVKIWYIDPTDEMDWLGNVTTEFDEAVNCFMPQLQGIDWSENMTMTRIVIPRNNNTGEKNSGILVLLYILFICAHVVEDNTFKEFTDNFEKGSLVSQFARFPRQIYRTFQNSQLFKLLD